MPELQDVFRRYGEQYRKTHKLSPVQHKTMRAIEQCRTARLGGHLDVCENCGDTKISYNSCRNRHCPKCQSLAKEKWIDHQKHNLLDIGYFHVVFTVPDNLRPVIYQNQAELYALLFRTAAETLQTLAAAKKYLGAKIGLTSILHTWGQSLSYHPHIHCIVPGGGLTGIGHWRSSSKKFFLPVRVLSRLFRGKFLDALRNANLQFFGSLRDLQDPQAFAQLLDACYRKEWVVYCKPPFRDAACVVEYLGRYTHRVAISNHRILNIDDGFVTFQWKDYRDENKQKVMRLTADEFIRRFLCHILPPGFMKIRHYGLLASRGKSQRLTLCKRLTNTPILQQATSTALDFIRKILGRDPSVCQVCGFKRTFCYMSLPPPTPA